MKRRSSPFPARPRGRRHLAALGAGLLLLAGAQSATAPGAETEQEKAGRCIEGSEQACLSLARTTDKGEERQILVVRTGVTDDSGIYALCGPQDEDGENAPNVLVFSESGSGGVRIKIDKNVIRVPLAVVTQRPGEEGKGSDGRVEASAGTARFLDAAPEGKTDRLSRCGVEVDRRSLTDAVEVTQGRTVLRGQSLVYDETDGLARIDGPITFNRDNPRDPLSGQSERIEINVDTEETLLVGNVVLKTKGGRVSRAGRVEYNDAAGTARLYPTPGQPAESVRGNDTLSIQSGSILYNLERNEVFADVGEGQTITGEFQDAQPATPTAPAPQTPTAPTPASP